MAVVMKQLGRSDEAIEAIKSFRHLCPPESQDSIDNILIELYKISGRIDEEIEMLQLKVKKVEEGIAFGKNRTKTARSQGRKVQITVEKEYSRLLGNLAWAYMQQQDFKSAEEQYRKSLTFESDKNKQCNLALCLMHMNKLTEAKFLLQTIRPSEYRPIDESYAKSYERASQTLSDLESQHALKPVKAAEFNSGFCFQQNHGSFQSPPVPHFLNKENTRAFTEVPSGKKDDFDRKSQEPVDYSRNRAYDTPVYNEGLLKVPFTQQRRCSWSLNNRDQRMSEQSIYGGFGKRLCFVPSTEVENVQSIMNQNANNCSVSSASPKMHLPSPPRDWRLADNLEILNRDPDQLLENNEERKIFEFPASKCKKSWADLVEEEEQEIKKLGKEFPGGFSICSMNNEGVNDENVDINTISVTPQLEKSTQRVESLHLELDSGYYTQPEKSNQPAVRRSLCFDQGKVKNHCTSPLLTKAFNF